MAKSDEFLHDHQVQRMLAPLAHVLAELQPLNREQRIRIVAGLAMFFGISIEVVERIERAGREGAQRGN
jgi:hypothetical protein